MTASMIETRLAVSFPKMRITLNNSNYTPKPHKSNIIDQIGKT